VVKSTYKIVWDRETLKEFTTILKFLQKQSDQAPVIVKDAIIKRLDVIKTNPLICEPDKLKQPQNHEFRAFVIFSYRVTYKINFKEKEILILRIRHTSQEPHGY